MFRFKWGGVDIAFVQKIDVLGVCIDVKINFNEHVHRICSKASAQISALQRLTGLIDCPSRKAIYTSFVASSFNYYPLVWLFTSRESINKIDKIQERALRFVLKDHISDYNDLLLRSGFHSFRIYAVKSLMIELFKILNGMTPNYLSEHFVKADTPYDTRDKCKLIQPLKRTTTYGLRVLFSITGCFFGSPRCHRWRQGRHGDNVTVYSEYISSMSPRRSHFCGVFVTGRTGGFHYENLRCGRRREYGIVMTASASRRTTSELLMRLLILVPKQTPHYTAKSLLLLIITRDSEVIMFSPGVFVITSDSEVIMFSPCVFVCLLSPAIAR